MNVNKDHIRNAFNSAAPQYNEWAHVQSTTAKKLSQFFQQQVSSTYLKNIQQILDVGCGTGLLTQTMLPLLNQKTIQITFCDIAPNMIYECKQYFQEYQNTQYIIADAEKDFHFHNQNLRYDLIMSNLSFQWFDDLIPSIKKFLQISNHLTFSTLLEGTFQEWHLAHHHIGRHPPNFTYPTAQQLVTSLQKLGDLRWHIEDESPFFNDPMDFIRSLKRTGASTLPVTACRGQDLRPLLKQFPTGINPTYRVFYGSLCQ